MDDLLVLFKGLSLNVGVLLQAIFEDVVLFAELLDEAMIFVYENNQPCGKLR